MSPQDAGSLSQVRQGAGAHPRGLSLVSIRMCWYQTGGCSRKVGLVSMPVVHISGTLIALYNIQVLSRRPISYILYGAQAEFTTGRASRSGRRPP